MRVSKRKSCCWKVRHRHTRDFSSFETLRLEKLHRSSRDNNRARDLDEELLIAKEVSVRLHGELEKSEESRMIMEKLNFALKQHLDTLKDSFDQRLQRVSDHPLLTSITCSLLSSGDLRRLSHVATIRWPVRVALSRVHSHGRVDLVECREERSARSWHVRLGSTLDGYEQQWRRVRSDEFLPAEDRLSQRRDSAAQTGRSVARSGHLSIACSMQDPQATQPKRRANVEFDQWAEFAE